MHELTIRISRTFCHGVFPQLNGELEAYTALASNSATSGVGERQTPKARVFFIRLSGAASGGEALGFCRSPTPD
ncbi:MAG: hypothetical protein FWF88_11925, partial [Peptococcaceae bacterium]|nr:hypothetical protein [Peptococcaceae bacterium]